MNDKNHRISRIKIFNHQKLQDFTTNFKKTHIFFKPKRNFSFQYQNQEENEHKNMNTKYDSINLIKQSRSLNLKQHNQRKVLLIKNNNDDQNRQNDLNNMNLNNMNRYGYSKSTQRISKKLPNLPNIFISNKLEQQKNTHFHNISQYSIQNRINGTNLGSLSTRQILKQYQLKKMRDELKSHEFLAKHIKQIKVQQYSSSDQQQDKFNNKKQKQQRFNLLTSVNNIQKTNKTNGNINQSKEKLINLLDNKVNDKDFIQYNVKLLAKAEINKKKYFKRYFDILQKKDKLIKFNEIQ